MFLMFFHLGALGNAHNYATTEVCWGSLSFFFVLPKIFVHMFVTPAVFWDEKLRPNMKRQRRTSVFHCLSQIIDATASNQARDILQDVLPTDFLRKLRTKSRRYMRSSHFLLGVAPLSLDGNQRRSRVPWQCTEEP